MWRGCDRLMPLGMMGLKKVSNFLIDEKLSLPEKENVTVVESGGEIVWVVGKRIDGRGEIQSIGMTAHSLSSNV